ncbi:Hypothetical protein POVR2_LOCUS166, partial [uncultured virus]
VKQILEARAIYPLVCYSESDGWSIDTGTYLWTLTVEQDKFTLQSQEPIPGIELLGTPVLYSYRDYARVRHCDDIDMFVPILNAMELDYMKTQDDLKLCAWLLLFVSEVYSEQANYKAVFDKSQLMVEYNDMLGCMWDVIAQR